MQYGICNLAIIPMRLEPSHKAEMVNQMLFGELYSVLETYNNWYKIVLQHDNYIGWIPHTGYNPISTNDFNKILNQKPYISGNLYTHIKVVNSYIEEWLPAGSFLYPINNNTFYAGNIRFSINSKDDVILIKDHQEYSIYSAASLFIGSPYLWGGRSPMGIDCSGLVQIAARMAGIFLPRDTSEQVHKGETIDFISEARAGDIAFFEDNEGNIIHTGIINDNGDIIHAHGYVRIDGIDHNGIYNKDTYVYSHKLRIIKRIT
ncbi:MAG TPA: C40 family peptidase [Bacteroidales bacterium]|nr:C40 family peptidase [Bacteroidales bacterium]